MQNEASSLRIKFLTPIVIMIVAIQLIMAMSLFYYQSKNQNNEILADRFNKTYSIAKQFYANKVKNDVNALKIVMASLKNNDKLAQVFATYDREAIYQYTHELFDNLKRDYNITHFYYTLPDQVNLLRVHAPNRYGDVINRTTTRNARTEEKLSYGIELGTLGTFTLRVVSPWYNEHGKLIGFIELGMEIDHVIESLESVFNVNATVVIFKKYLEREDWEKGMNTLGRDNDWDRFPDVVLSSSDKVVPKLIHDHLLNEKHEYHDHVVHLENNNKSYWLLTIPITDVQGQNIAHMALLADVSLEMNATEQVMTVVGISVFLLGIILIVFFTLMAKKVGSKLENDEKALQELAMRDSLTGLYTRRIFDMNITLEIDRSKRFNHPLSVLILDIDHFKKINDTYGHLVGDKVLRILCKRLIDVAREVDVVCRYGGEEFIILAPETNKSQAIELANRLLKAVSGMPVDVNTDSKVNITVSIGVASYPEDADTGILLITAADEALYAAKQNGRNQIVVS